DYYCRVSDSSVVLF
nr:immunoglobulin light chain junction region [Macaca mulatta]